MGIKSSRMPVRMQLSCLLLIVSYSFGQSQSEHGHPVGRVSVDGNLIVVELNQNALGKANLFDLTGHTLRFAPDGSRYRVSVERLQWDADYGAAVGGAEVTLHNFSFPFSGHLWTSFLLGQTGSIRFGPSGQEIALDPYGYPEAGIVLDRFEQLADAAPQIGAQAPVICVFLKPRMSGPRYVKELRDSAVITWDLTEPYGGLLDFSWWKTTDRFQAVLHRDGRIDLSYDRVTARDGIVGIYPRMPVHAKPAAVHFSSLSPNSGPFAAVYEAFHYLAVPRPQDLSCTVIQALGDHFDFLAYYSDFRIDSQEASTPSDGPIGGNVTGSGDTKHPHTLEILASRCTQGRFQLGFAQPVFVGSNEAQPGPPEGAPVGSPHTLSFYTRALSEASPDGRPFPYNYAVGHLGHEIGHRWSAYVSAKLGGNVVSLGTWPHWAPGLQTRVAFPYSLPTEASTEGGGAWQDNHDGTYTQLHDGYFVPADGYSYLDLYLMGFVSASEVPDFFLLNGLTPVGKDSDGRSVFRAERTNITVQDVIAAVGKRFPDVDHSQRNFNTGFVVMVEHGHAPSPLLMQRANGIRRQWLRFWDTTTGHRAVMTANAR